MLLQKSAGLARIPLLNEKNQRSPHSALDQPGVEESLPKEPAATRKARLRAPAIPPWVLGIVRTLLASPTTSGTASDGWLTAGATNTVRTIKCLVWVCGACLPKPRWQWRLQCRPAQAHDNHMRKHSRKKMVLQKSAGMAMLRIEKQKGIMEQRRASVSILNPPPPSVAPFDPVPGGHRVGRQSTLHTPTTDFMGQT